MKKARKILSLFLSLSLLSSPLCATAFAETDTESETEAVTSGICGKNVVWNYDADTKTLTFDGTGNMNSYYFSTPWDDLKSEIETAIVGDGITSVSEASFFNCPALKNISIGKSVEKMTIYAFRNDAESYRTYPQAPIENLTVSEENEYFSSRDNVLFNKDETELIFYPAGLADTGYTFPETVKIVGYKAFNANKTLQKIVFNEGLTVIDPLTFTDCSSLAEISIPDTVTNVSANAFKGTAYYNDESNRENGVLYCGAWLLNCPPSVTSLTVREGTVGIARSAIESGSFSNKSVLSTVYLPSSLTEMENGALSICQNLTQITVHEDNPLFSSQDGILYNKEKNVLKTYPASRAATSFTVPETVTEIGYAAFRYGKKLSSVTLPEGLLSIGKNAFYSCSNLVTLTLPEGLSDIDDYAFYGCSKLDFETIPKSVTHIGDWAFSDTVPYRNMGDDNLLYIDDCLVYARKDDTVFRIEIKDGTRLLADNLFYYDFPSVTTLVLPASLEYVGEFAAWGLKNLERVCYRGTREKWADISIGEYNDPLQSAALCTSFTLSTAERKSDGLYVTVVPYNTENHRLYAAGYRDDKLAELQTTLLTGEETLLFGSDIEKVILYVWDENFASDTEPERIYKENILDSSASAEQE